MAAANSIVVFVFLFRHSFYPPASQTQLTDKSSTPPPAHFDLCLCSENWTKEPARSGVPSSFWLNSPTRSVSAWCVAGEIKLEAHRSFVVSGGQSNLKPGGRAARTPFEKCWGYAASRIFAQSGERFPWKGSSRFQKGGIYSKSHWLIRNTSLNTKMRILRSIVSLQFFWIDYKRIGILKTLTKAFLNFSHWLLWVSYRDIASDLPSFMVNWNSNERMKILNSL